MKVKVFIDGSSGTTGLRIADRLAARPEIELLSISAEGRKDVHERAKVINSADLAFLCLPDAASKEVMPLLRPDVKVLDTSTAFRTDAAWDYGFPELKGLPALPGHHEGNLATCGGGYQTDPWSGVAGWRRDLRCKILEMLRRSN